VTPFAEECPVFLILGKDHLPVKYSLADQTLLQRAAPRLNHRKQVY